MIFLVWVLLLVPGGDTESPPWGFYAHRLINEMAVYSLPPEMFGFFKKHIDYISENAVNPDRRRYAVLGEAPRHFIDFDYYPDSVRTKLPKMTWERAVEQIGEEILMENGTAPWQVQRMTYQLTEAFKRRNTKEILRISTDLGHYIADSNVPLHTTLNYNGQMTGQHGLHAFWESRLPELFAKDYHLMVGKASYEENIMERSWAAILNAHTALDSVLTFERQLTLETDDDKKFSIDERNGLTVRAYSREFSKKFHDMLDGQVEKQLKASIIMVADLWFTAWVNAGQPDLSDYPKYVATDEEVEKQTWLKRIFNVRQESDY